MSREGDLLGQIAALLELEKELGTEWIPIPRKTSPAVEPPRPPSRPDAAAAPPPVREQQQPAPRRAAGLPRLQKPLTTADPVEIARRAELLAAIDSQVKGCARCVLHEKRTKTVFSDGSPAARLCFVGEGPGADEDASGVPFVGRAGKLLTSIIQAMGLTREETYICNTVKCRPPQNRTPQKDEMETCFPHLEKQLDVLGPDCIVALGLPAAQSIVGSAITAISKNRGRWMRWRSIPVMLTYHPAYLLRNPAAKTLVWEDMQKVYEFLSTGKGVAPADDAPPPAPKPEPPRGGETLSIFGRKG